MARKRNQGRKHAAWYVDLKGISGNKMSNPISVVISGFDMTKTQAVKDAKKRYPKRGLIKVKRVNYK